MTTETKDAEAMVEFLYELIDNAAEEHEAPVRSVQTFEEVGMLTRDAGLVVTMTDGTEYQVTVVQSRMARG
ncbi:MAG: hypothetical protein ACREAA_02850 [Candidatus Polarisedimenticolia bacterium]